MEELVLRRATGAGRKGRKRKEKEAGRRGAATRITPGLEVDDVLRTANQTLKPFALLVGVDVHHQQKEKIVGDLRTWRDSFAQDLLASEARAAPGDLAIIIRARVAAVVALAVSTSADRRARAVDQTKAVDWLSALFTRDVMEALLEDRLRYQMGVLMRRIPCKQERNLDIEQDRRELARLHDELKQYSPNAHYVDFSREDFKWSEEIERCNRMIFGHQELRPTQRQIMNAIMSGSDTVVTVPAAGGSKPLLYQYRCPRICQLPAVCASGVTVVVIAPLVALIHDQLKNLRARYIACDYFAGSRPVEEEDEVYKDLAQPTPTLKLLYVTPEKIARSERFVGILKTMYDNNTLARFVVDESHCVSLWGHDSQPNYKDLQVLKELFPAVPIVAVTSCASREITDQLRIPQAVEFRAFLNRPNLRYEVRPKRDVLVDQLEDIKDLLQAEFTPDQSGIVYCLSCSDCEAVAECLRSEGFLAGHYHARMAQRDRDQIQQHWNVGAIKIIVTTIAFNLGIDTSHVRFVIHHCFPASIESYYEESGRAGRDGHGARCILYYRWQDLTRIMESNKEKAKSDGSWRRGLYQMVAYSQDPERCRRSMILERFGDPHAEHRCADCDTCTRGSCSVLTDVSEPCRAVLDIVTAIKQSRPLDHVVHVFRGNSKKLGLSALKAGHDKLLNFGYGKNMTEHDTHRLFSYMLSQQYITIVVLNKDAKLKLGPRAYRLHSGLDRPRIHFEGASPSFDGSQKGDDAAKSLASGESGDESDGESESEADDEHHDLPPLPPGTDVPEEVEPTDSAGAADAVAAAAVAPAAPRACEAPPPSPPSPLSLSPAAEGQRAPPCGAFSPIDLLPQRSVTPLTEPEMKTVSLVPGEAATPPPQEPATPVLAPASAFRYRVRASDRPSLPLSAPPRPQLQEHPSSAAAVVGSGGHADRNELDRPRSAPSSSSPRASSRAAAADASRAAPGARRPGSASSARSGSREEGGACSPPVPESCGSHSSSSSSGSSGRREEGGGSSDGSSSRRNIISAIKLFGLDELSFPIWTAPASASHDELGSMGAAIDAQQCRTPADRYVKNQNIRRWSRAIRLAGERELEERKARVDSALAAMTDGGPEHRETVRWLAEVRKTASAYRAQVTQIATVAAALTPLRAQAPKAPPKTDAHP